MNSSRDTQGRGDMIGAERYSVEELREVIFERRETEALSPALAVALLAKKDYPGKIEDFERILDSETQPRRVQRAAVTSLAQMKTEEAETVLIRRLTIQDLAVRRTVAESLRSLGTERAIEALRQMEPPDTPKEPAAPGERPLPRGGIQDFELRPPRAAIMAPPLQEAEPVRFYSMEPEAVQAIVRRLDHPVSIALSAERGYVLECFGRELTVLLSEELAEDPPVAWLRERQQVVGVVAAHYTLESDTYSARYYVLTQPAEDEGAMRIFVTTLNGDVVYTGEASIEGDTVRFRIQGLERPGSTPLLIEGLFEDGEVRFERALSQRPTRSQRLSPRPR